MSHFAAALWAEALKARRSRMPWLTALGFSLAPLSGGLFMFILQDLDRARALGLLSAKAQLAGGADDWPTLFGMLAQATAIGGMILFALVTVWVFGREFSDRTAKELLALPTPREAIVAAKFVVIAIWSAALTALVFGLGLVAGVVVGLPDASPALVRQAAGHILLTGALTLALIPLVALLASVGRGYLPPMGWTFLTVFLAQIIAALGWGAWFPWSVPALFSGVAGPRAAELGPHSYLVVALACVAGLVATFGWWRRADQTR